MSDDILIGVFIGITFLIIGVFVAHIVTKTDEQETETEILKYRVDMIEKALQEAGDE